MPLKPESGQFEEWKDFLQFETMVLLSIHAMEQAQSHQYHEDDIDKRRRNGQNCGSTVTQEPSDTHGERATMFRWDVLEDCERADHVEDTRVARSILWKQARIEAERCGQDFGAQIRVETDTIAQCGAEDLEQLAVVASDIEHPRTPWDDSGRTIDAPVPDEAIEGLHADLDALASRRA